MTGDNVSVPSRKRQHLGILAALFCLGVAPALLAGCSSNDASSLGHQACLDVQRALRDFSRADHEPPAAANRDRNASLVALRAAVSPAALAASSDGTWQALMATLSETSRVPENYLVTALTDQCAQTLSQS